MLTKSICVQPLVLMLPKSGYLESHQLLRWWGQNHLWWASRMKSQGMGGPIQIWELRDVTGSVPLSTSVLAFLEWSSSQGTPEPLDSFPSSPGSAAENNCLITKFHPRGFAGSSDGKKSAWNAGYCPWGHKESDTTEWLTQVWSLLGVNIREIWIKGEWELSSFYNFSANLKSFQN